MARIAQLWRTSTVRLTATFILIFVVFSVLLLGLIWYQSSIQIQRQQSNDIDREVLALQRLERQEGPAGVYYAVRQLASQPGPGLYYLALPTGEKVAGNVDDLPVEVLQGVGTFSFNYERDRPLAEGRRQGNAFVRSVVLDTGLILVVGRDVFERRGFTAIIFQSFLVGVVGILVFSVIAGLITAMRVLQRVEAIGSTANKIMSGNLSERVPVTRRNDEFDGLATSLNTMLDRIELLLQGLKEVTDNVAHDLKTPLTRLRNQAEAALRDTSDEARRKQALETVIAESDKLIRTFNALLMIARAEAGAPSGALTELDLSAVAADVGELYGPVAEEAGMTLVTDVSDGIHIRGNRELLGQALVNLVDNALKYYEPVDDKAGTITIGAHKAQGRVLLTVADNGRGVPAEDRHRIIERWVRLEKSRTEPGSGLGLSLVAAVARLHGGELRIEDNNPGLRAVIDLPAG